MVLYLQSLKYKEVTVAQDNSIDNVEVRKYYYKSGALRWETPYVNGKKQGIERCYYESGALMAETPCVKGKMHGIAKDYYESGAIWREIPYVNGGRNGIERGYYESGALMAETPCVNGKKHGIAKHYDKDNINIDRLVLYERSHEVLTLCLESYGAVSTKS